MRTAEELRRLDALAAEKCMGWHENNGIWCGPSDSFGPFVGIWCDPINGLGPLVEDWHPTTDPKDCQSLKDKARADGWSYQITFLLDEVRAGVWKPPVSMDTYFDAVDDSELVAVVLACVRAYGAEV